MMHIKEYLQNHFICLFVFGVWAFMMLFGGEYKHQNGHLEKIKEWEDCSN